MSQFAPSLLPVAPPEASVGVHIKANQTWLPPKSLLRWLHPHVFLSSVELHLCWRLASDADASYRATRLLVCSMVMYGIGIWFDTRSARSVSIQKLQLPHIHLVEIPQTSPTEKWSNGLTTSNDRVSRPFRGTRATNDRCYRSSSKRFFEFEVRVTFGTWCDQMSDEKSTFHCRPHLSLPFFTFCPALSRKSQTALATTPPSEPAPAALDSCR